MSWLVFTIYPPNPTELANLTTRTERQYEPTTTPPPLFHLPRVQKRAGGGLFSGFNAASIASTLPRILMQARGGPFWRFNTSATTTTSLASRCEPEVDLSMVSMPLPLLPPPSHPNASQVDFSVVPTLLPPLPPPSLPNASWRWIILKPPPPFEGILPAASTATGRCETHTPPRSNVFPALRGSLGGDVTALFTTPQ